MIPALPPPASRARIRVATVPHRDPYVDAVLPESAVPVGPDHDPSPWLDPAYLTAWSDRVDVVHVHTGYGHLPEDEVVSWTEALRRTGVPLVVTVHQLRDPTQPTRHRHDAHLAALLATAEVVFTLTPGAADEIADRFGRTSIVVAHPSVAAADPDTGAEPVGRAVVWPDRHGRLRQHRVHVAIAVRHRRDADPRTGRGRGQCGDHAGGTPPAVENCDSRGGAPR